MVIDAWRAQVKCLLKGELKRRKITYFDLANRLSALGIEEDEKNIAKKVSRGSFTAIFLFQCLAAIDCEDLRLNTPFAEFDAGFAKFTERSRRAAVGHQRELPVSELCRFVPDTRQIDNTRRRQKRLQRTSVLS